MRAVSKRDVLSTAEFRSALEALTPADGVRIQNKAAFLALDTGFSPEDLFQEAVRRALEDGEGRNCPRDVLPVVFIGNTMRSIASAEREKWKRAPPFGRAKEGEIDPIDNMPDSSPSPEEAAITNIDGARSIVQIEAVFEGDSKALAVVIGDMEGWSPNEIREMEPMSEKEYAAARKRVRRAISSHFPEGPKHD